MAIGSPALAGYSLAITSLNTRWLKRQFSSLHFSNKEHILPVVAALQHIPFSINATGPPLPSLIVLPQNDQWWEHLGAAVKRIRQDSVSVTVGLLWVVLAASLTLMDSFLDFGHFITIPGAAGYSIVAVWSFLFPLVAGWLVVGYQRDANYIREALEGAHQIAYIATAAEPVLVARVTGRPVRGIEPSMSHIDYANADEGKTAPIFNYSRVFIWSQHAEHILRLYKHATNKANRGIAVRRRGKWVGNNNDRVGNEAEVVKYCMEEHGAGADVYRRHPDGEASATEGQVVPVKPVFATEVFRRVAFATVLALGLQWFTTGAAIHVHLKTPPKGIGCRAMSFVVYGAAATVAFWILLFSSVLSHLARRQSIRGRRSCPEGFVGCIAMFTRWLGKSIAILNGFGLLGSSVMQFSGIYDNCFCSSTVFGGYPNGVVRFVEDIKSSEVEGPWNLALVMAFVVSICYGSIVSAPPTVVMVMEAIWSLCKGFVSLFVACLKLAIVRRTR